MYPSSSYSNNAGITRKRIVIFAVVFFGFVIAVTVFSLVSKNVPGFGSSLKPYSSSSFAVSYPSSFAPEQNAQSTNYLRATFKPVPEEGSGSPVKVDSMTVTRYGSATIPLTTLEKIDSSAKNRKMSKKNVNGKQALVVTNSSSSDESTTVTYYIYSEVYIWEIRFVYYNDSDLEKNIGKIAASFKSNDDDLIKLKGGNTGEIK